MTDGLLLQNVTLTLNGQTLINLPYFQVAPGQVATIMGPSGSGKSSLLNYLCGTLDQAIQGKGQIIVGGTRIDALSPERRHLGILFQDDLLFPHLSVGENITFGLPPEIRGRIERRRHVEAMLAEVELDGFADRDPATLSGGQKIRVALMRTLAANPRALLLDEPFSKLDASLRERIRALVFAKAVERNLPVLMVTHDIADAEAAKGSVVQLA